MYCMAYYLKLKAGKLLLRLVLRFAGGVLIQRNCGRSLG